MELESRRKEDRIVHLHGEKESLSKEVKALKAEAEQMKAAGEKMAQEKWEAQAQNNDLKTRLQQSMAMSYMQVRRR